MAEVGEQGGVERASIEQETAHIRNQIQGIIADAREGAYTAERFGIEMRLGDGRVLTTGGEDVPRQAPSLHPVWSDELRDETHDLRAIAEIDNRARPWEEDYAKWPTFREPLLGEGDSLQAYYARQAQREAYVRDHSDPALALTKGEQRAYDIAHGWNTDDEERGRGHRAMEGEQHGRSW